MGRQSQIWGLIETRSTRPVFYTVGAGGRETLSQSLQFNKRITRFNERQSVLKVLPKDILQNTMELGNRSRVPLVASRSQAFEQR